MVANEIPGRVFLDTCVVNFMLDFGQQIHDGAAIPQVPHRDSADIEALRDLFLIGQRAMWQLAISPHTYFEIACTRDILNQAFDLSLKPIDCVAPARKIQLILGSDQ